MEERRIGFLVGAVIGIALLAVIVLIAKARNKKAWCDYDERQLQARGKAFQYGFVTLLCYNVCYAVLCEETLLDWCSNSFGVTLGIGIALMVFGVYSIWNDAFMQLSQSPSAVYSLFGGVGACNLILGICHIADGTIIENNQVGFQGVNLVLGITMLTLAAVFGIKNHLDKREED